MKTIQIDDSTSKGKALLKYLLTLDFVKEKSSTDFPGMTEKEILDRVEVTNKQIKQGKTISNEDLRKESENW